MPGCAVSGLLDLVKQAGGIVEGVGICIEKGFQGGGDALREAGYDVRSLAVIENGCRNRRHYVSLRRPE